MKKRRTGWIYHEGAVEDSLNRKNKENNAWNKREIYKVLNGFSGDYYVAASIIECYRKKFDEIVKEYDIDKKRIHIIDDLTYRKFK